MKKTLLTALAFLLPAAAAHEVVSYGTVSAEFHVGADESLRVNDDTLVGFRLLVKGQPVDAKACRCQLLLYPGKPSARVMPQILELGEGFDDPLSAEAWAKVTAAGPYTLVLAGKPQERGAFDPFRVEYRLTAK